MKIKVEETLQKLDQMLSQINSQVYNKVITPSGDATIGKHTRHIIEFFLCLLEQYQNGIVNYDKRKRNPEIETDLTIARNEIGHIIALTGKLPLGDDKLSLETGEDTGVYTMETSLERELWYNVEHAIHHMAIIKMVISYEHPDLKLDEDFGVAYSTVQYHKQAFNTN